MLDECRLLHACKFFHCDPALEHAVSFSYPLALGGGEAGEAKLVPDLEYAPLARAAQVPPLEDDVVGAEGERLRALVLAAQDAPSIDNLCCRFRHWQPGRFRLS